MSNGTRDGENSTAIRIESTSFNPTSPRKPPERNTVRSGIVQPPTNVVLCIYLSILYIFIRNAYGKDDNDASDSSYPIGISAVSLYGLPGSDSVKTTIYGNGTFKYTVSPKYTTPLFPDFADSYVLYEGSPDPEILAAKKNYVACVQSSYGSMNMVSTCKTSCTYGFLQRPWTILSSPKMSKSVYNSEFSRSHSI